MKYEKRRGNIQPSQDKGDKKMSGKVNDKKTEKGLEVIKLTQIATWVLIVVAAVADVFGYYICKYVWGQILVGWDQFRPITNEGIAFPMLIAFYYVATIFAYVILFNMLKLLDNMKASKVFVKDNT